MSASPESAAMLVLMRPIEAIEELGLGLRRDANAVIPHRQNDFLILNQDFNLDGSSPADCT